MAKPKMNQTEQAVLRLIAQAKGHQAAQHGCAVEDLGSEQTAGLDWLEFAIKEGVLREEKAGR